MEESDKELERHEFNVAVNEMSAEWHTMLVDTLLLFCNKHESSTLSRVMSAVVSGLAQFNLTAGRAIVECGGVMSGQVEREEIIKSQEILKLEKQYGTGEEGTGGQDEVRLDTSVATGPSSEGLQFRVPEV